MKEIDEIIKDLQAGKFVIVQDDKKRENEADLIMAAEFATKEKIAFLLDHCSGIVCVPITEKKVQELGLEKISPINSDKKTTPYTVSIDSKKCHTGVSAEDRYLTIKQLADENSTIKDFIVPGHVFPLYAHEQGLKKRSGHTEAAIELMKMANLKPISVICELMYTSANCQNHEKIGMMIKGEQVKEFSKKYNIPIIDIYILKKYAG